MPKNTKSERIKNRMFSEVFDKPPKIVKHTAKKFGALAAKKQKIAIALSKARKAGALV